MRFAPAVSRLVIAGALLPVPIGAGPGYNPSPGAHGVCGRGSLASGGRVHLEVFANSRVVIIPAGIGLRGARLRFGRVTTARCRERLWTTDPSGVVHFVDAVTLGDLFRIWRQPLGRTRLLGFRGRVRLYLDGRLAAGDPRRLVLPDRAELVLEVGRYVPPHRSYRFPR
jgi:hypothetical protein